MIRRGVFDKNPKAPIKRISAKVKEIKFGPIVITTKRVIMFGMETTTSTTTLTGVTMVIETIKVIPILPLKIGKLLKGMVKVEWSELKICCRR